MRVEVPMSKVKAYNMFHIGPDSCKNGAKFDENILTALKAKNYGVQFSDLNMMIFTN